MNFAGDALLFVFGFPEAAADDAQRALRFVTEVFAQTSDDGIALRVRGHAGPVTLSLLGGS